MLTIIVILSKLLLYLFFICILISAFILCINLTEAYHWLFIMKGLFDIGTASASVRRLVAMIREKPISEESTNVEVIISKCLLALVNLRTDYRLEWN